MWLLLIACGGNPPSQNIYDRDSDGFLSFEDCDDENAGIYPGAPEVYYDGRDANCDGADDYDQDGDGYVWEVHGGEDCDDTDPLVNPEGTEVPYDGADNDCDPSTLEDDLDQDGFRRSDDCDDDDPNRYPGAPEWLADGIDQDCRDDGDSTILQRSSELLTRPKFLRASTFEGRPAFAFATERVDFLDVDATTGYDPTPLDPEPDPLLQVVRIQIDPLSDDHEELTAFGSEHDDAGTADVPTAVDLAEHDGTLWVGIGYSTWRQADLRLRLSPFVRFNDDFVRQNGPSRTLDGATGSVLHVDVQLDGEEATVAASGDDSLTTMRGVLGEVGGGAGGTAVSEGGGGTAVVDGELWSCDADGDCTSWTIPVDGAPTDPQPLTGITRILRERDGLVLVQDDDYGAVVEGLDIPLEVFPADKVIDADIVHFERGDGTLWVATAAVVEGGAADRVALAYGPADAGLLTSVFLAPPDGDTGFPIEVALWADAERLVLGALTQDFALYDSLWLAELPWAL